MQSQLPLTTIHPDPMDSPHMEWLATVAGMAGLDGDRVLTVQECADSVRMSVRAVRQLIDCGQLESVRAGTRQSGDHRITVRSWLTHLYRGWSCRSSATHLQVLALIMELLGGVPPDDLKTVALHCVELRASRRAAAQRLNSKRA